MAEFETAKAIYNYFMVNVCLCKCIYTSAYILYKHSRTCSRTINMRTYMNETNETMTLFLIFMNEMDDLYRACRF